MTRGRSKHTISVYIPERAQAERVTERLKEIGRKRDRSLNYMVVEAILQYLDREGA